MAGPEIVPDPNAPTGTGPRADQAVRPGIDYRQIVQPYEMKQPWHIPPSGAAEEAGELSRAFEQFSRAASGLGSTLANKQAKIEGTAAGNQPGFQPKTGIAALTEAGQVYNAAAGISYINSAQSSIEQQIAQAEIANPRDPVAFAQHAQAIRDETLKQTPQLYAPEIQNYLDKRIAAGNIRVAEQTMLANQRDAEWSYSGTRVARLQAAVETAGKLGGQAGQEVIHQFVAQDTAQRQALVHSGAWSQERANGEMLITQQMAQHAIDQHHAHEVANNFMDTLRLHGPAAADKEVAAYMQDSKNSDDDKQRVLKDYEQQHEQNLQLQGQVHANEIAALDQRLQHGKGILGTFVGESGQQIETDLRTAYDKGWISQSRFVSMMGTAKANAIRANQVDMTNQVLEAHYQSGQPFDPADRKVVKALGPWFDGHMKMDNTPYGSQGYANSATAFVQNFEAVPDTIKSNIRTHLLSGDPDAVVYAANLAHQITQANPRAALYDFQDTKTSALADLVYQNTQAGMSPANAMALAHKQVDVTRAEQDNRNDEYLRQQRLVSTDKPDLANASALNHKLQDQFGGFFKNGQFHFDAPGADNAFRTQFDTLTKEYFTQYGTLKDAQNAAYRQLMTQWGLTKVNGTPEFSQYPISDADVPRVQANMKASLAALQEQGYAPKDVDPATLRLVRAPGGRTEASNGQVWTVTYNDKNGDPQPLINPQDHRPILLDRDAGKATFQQQMDERKAVAAQAAHDLLQGDEEQATRHMMMGIR